MPIGFRLNIRYLAPGLILALTLLAVPPSFAGEQPVWRLGSRARLWRFGTLAIFGAFERPDVGGLVVLVLIVPIVGLAWLDHAVLRSRAAAYLRERAAHAPKTNPPA